MSNNPSRKWQRQKKKVIEIAEKNVCIIITDETINAMITYDQLFFK